MSITKARADKCVTHHYACNCREYRAQKMEAALRVILVWVTVAKELGDTRIWDDVEEKCQEALK